MANPRFNNLKVWPHLTLVFLGFAALGAVAAALWMRHEPKAEALALPRAARVERVEGEVGLGRALDEDAEGRWMELTPNTPLTEGDRLYAREDARASLAFTGRNRARIDPGSALDVVSLSDRRTQLALRDGSAVFDIGHLEPDEVFEVATPYGAVDLREPGLYEVGYNDDGSAFVSVLSGLAQVIGLAGSGQVSKGEMLTLLGQTAAQVALSRLSPDYAGGLLDDYYGYQYPDAYDGRYADYNAYLNDPYHYDPYLNSNASYRYVPASVPGAYDLDRYGDWQNLGGHGYAWSPRVESGWAPYREGYWMLDDPYGPTWVSNEPWGYAPYHYGRWVNSDGRWFWVPDAANTQPAYAPALVAFLPQAGSELIGWAPLAPGEPYAPAFYDANWQPHYVGGEPAFPERLVNLNTPGGLTVVPVGDFYNVVEHDRLARFDPRAFDGVRPARDPLSHAVLRQLSLTHAAERRGFALPPGLARKLEERQVYASAPPQARPFREDIARRLGVAALPEKHRKEKLQFTDEREQRREGKAEERAARRSDARQERRQRFDARSEQRRQEFPQAERVAARGDESARGERGGGQARREQRESERQQQRAAAEQQRSLIRQQAEASRQGRQQAAAQRAQQQAAERAQRQEMRSRQSQPRGRGAERQHQQQRPAAQAPQGRGRGGQRHAEKQQGGGRHSGGPPQGKQQGGGKGGGKGKGKN